MTLFQTLLTQQQHPLGGDLTGLGDFQPDTGGNGISQIERIFTTIFGFLTIVGGLMFLIYFIVGGLGWITAGGDQQKIDNAKNKMTGAAIGLIIIVAAYAITWIVGTVLGLDILNLGESFSRITGDGGGGGG